MTVPKNSLRGFLAHAKSALRHAIDSSQKVTLVIGNESADLDSMSCAILFAYARTLSSPRNAFSSLYVPITNIPASDIALRPEYSAVFKHADMDSQHLITLDDLPPVSDIGAQLDPAKTRWILVDHNALQGRLGSIYADQVAGVIDHHDDEGKVVEDTGVEPRIIEKSGSCTSLVANYCRAIWDSSSAPSTSSGTRYVQGDGAADKVATGRQWDAAVAKLGLASILIDTANLLEENKTTEHDRQAAKYLEAKIMGCARMSAGFDRSSFYEEINAAKKDIGGLELPDILRKDYKQWDQEGMRLGISSVVKPIAFLQEKAGGEAFLDVLRQFSKDRGLNLYALMTTSTSAEGAFQRELLLWAFDGKAASVAESFGERSKDELGLEDWQGSGTAVDTGPGDGEWRQVWWQRQVQHSRKRVAPLVRAAMCGRAAGEDRR